MPRDVPRDDALTERIRAHIGARTDVSEAAMFGGVAFLLSGNIAVTASGRGLMVRVGRDGEAAVLVRTGALPVVMSGRVMRGWIHVATASLASDHTRHPWVDQVVAFAASLPAKGG